MTSESTQPALPGFVLTRSQYERRGRLVLEYWLHTPEGPVRALVESQNSAVFFVKPGVRTLAGQRKALQLQAADGTPVEGVYFDSLRSLRDERDRLLQAGVHVLEGDVLPSDRYLMERFIAGGVSAHGRKRAHSGYSELLGAELRAGSYAPQLRIASFDIETDGLEGSVLSIAIVCDAVEQVLMLAAPGGSAEPVPADTTEYSSEGALITAFCQLVQALDPDLLIGWNVIEFDIAVLLRRAALQRVPLALGRDGSAPTLTSQRPVRARLAGRVVLDGIGSLRAASHMLESYALEDVAQHFLGRGKALDDVRVDRVAEVLRMFRDDRAALARYNLEDCRLARDIFQHADLIGFLVERAQLTGLALDRVAGAVAALDYVYLPRLHRAGFVAPSVGASAEAEPSPGGYVLDSIPGLYSNIVVLDFKSLYPSIIRTFRIDPLGLWVAGDDAVAGFANARFDRTRSILPDLITQLWQSRDEAKKKHDNARSYAIKILMNSFYGVLGTPTCRFFDPRLASSITLRGHEIITRSRDFLEARGHKVIYGDTDSLFVSLPDELAPEACVSLGEQLASALTAHWTEQIAREHRLQSQLEMELDTHYLRFFMPTLRDSEQGSKKRYAGLVRTEHGLEVEFKGLEAVRTDWTPLARQFQRELYRRVFVGEPYEAYARDLVAQLFAGKLDRALVYRKRLRRDLNEYVKNVPPHVRAARKLGGTETPREVSYYMTTRGPEPVGLRSAPLDYQHYLERQLAPAADSLLQHFGISFLALVDAQLELF
jgi:DNA polymerase II